MTHKNITQLLLLVSCVSTQHTIFCMDQQTAEPKQQTNLEKIIAHNEETLADVLEKDDPYEEVSVAVPNTQSWWQWLTWQKKTYTYKETTLKEAREHWNRKSKAADLIEVLKQIKADPKTTGAPAEGVGLMVQNFL